MAGMDRDVSERSPTGPEPSAPLVRSPLLSRYGLLHGFSLRTGGVSAPPFDSLNLGRLPGDDPAAVAENHRRLGAAVGYAAGQLFEVSQVHGRALLEPGADDVPEVFRGQEADALVSLRAGTPIGVRTADCMPVLLADPETGAVAAAHAGWRGVVAGVVPAAVEALCGRAAAPPARLVAAMMPHIRACCFEVGDEVVAQLQAGLDPEDAARMAVPRTPRPHADLTVVVRAQLRRAGLSPERVDDVPGCTCCEPERFFSYRRDGAASGRHLAVIVASHPAS